MRALPTADGKPYDISPFYEVGGAKNWNLDPLTSGAYLFLFPFILFYYEEERKVDARSPNRQWKALRYFFIYLFFRFAKKRNPINT